MTTESPELARRAIVDRVSGVQNKNVLSLIYSFLSEEGKVSNYTSNQNGIFFNLSKLPDDTIEKLTEILDQTDKHMAEYGQIETERKNLLSIVSKSLKREKEEEIKASERNEDTQVVLKTPQTKPKSKKEPELEEDDYDNQMKRYLRKPVYKGSLARIDKILRKRKSSSSAASQSFNKRIFSRGDDCGPNEENLDIVIEEDPDFGHEDEIEVEEVLDDFEEDLELEEEPESEVEDDDLESVDNDDDPEVDLQIELDFD